jgi:hypothetical protein
MNVNNISSKRRTIHLSKRTWQRAVETAQHLNLSTSQFLSRLVVETSPLIRPNSLLGLRRNASAMPRSFSER